MCLDLNVLVAAEIALIQGKQRTTPLRLLHAARSGVFDLIMSRSMLDRLGEVLTRPPLALGTALVTERTESLAELAALSNLLGLGGGVLPMRDEEDRAVLEAALAGRAEYLGTYNLGDFERVALRDPNTSALRLRDLLIVHVSELALALGC